MPTVTIPAAILQASTPGVVDLIIVPGSDKSIPIAFLDSAGVAIAITGCTGTAKIKNRPGGDTLASGTVTVASNVATVVFAGSATAAITPLVPSSDDPLRLREPLIAGVWDLKLAGTTDICVPVVGNVYVIPAVT